MENQHSSPQPGLDPLPGEPGIPSVHQAGKAGASPKVIAAVAVMLLSLGLAGYAAIHSFTKDDKKAAKAAAKAGPQAAVDANTAPKKFDPMNVPDGAPSAPQPLAVSNVTSVPGIEPTEADPIGVRSTRTRAQEGSSDATRAVSPLDSSASLTLAANTDGNPRTPVGSPEDERVSAAKVRMAELQDTMKGLVSNLGAVTKQSTAPATPAAAPKPAAVALGGLLTASATARVNAGMLSNRSLTLPKGSTFNCALKTRIVSEQSGFVSCQVLRNAYSDDGRVLLIERGSHMDGEYIAKYRQGQTRIFVVWSRVRTSNGVTVDIDSPATGPLGEAGVDGYVDNHWGERFGAAMLVTIIDDAVKITVANQQSGASTVVAQDSGDTMAKVAEKMLDSTINIPPTIYKNQGEVVGIYVSKDVDFSQVYELKVAQR